MEINKRCISAFAKTGPFVALATKSKILDTAFSLTSELILINYMTGHIFPSITTEHKFCKILWCEFPDGNSNETRRILVAGHENGVISLYEHKEEGLVLLKSKECLEDDIVALDFLVTKAVLVAASSKGKIIFWTLTNLEKEFNLDVPLPQNISAVSCNPKVVKILCVGTTDGTIKVVDIKKLSVILTLKNKDFSEVKELDWDSENSTKLRVMSEKGFITIFDLSNDSTSQLGSHENPLIGFQGSTLVSKNKLETNGVSIDIPESFECSISPRDPVIALSQCSGITRIMSIPVYKKRIPFCRSTCHILTPNFIYKILVRNDYEADTIDSFYEQLIRHVNSSEPIDILGNFLLDNHSTYSPTDERDGIEIDLKNNLEYEFVKNYFDSLRTCNTPIDLSILDIIRSRDLNRIFKLNDFKLILVLCKLLNDYSALSRLKNPRILAAILIFHQCGDYTPLESTEEGQVIRSILEKDYSRYLDLFSKIIKSSNYLVTLKEYERLITSIQPFITKKIESKKLSEYFWYEVFMGNLEKVQNLNVSDPEIQLYLQMQNEKAYDLQSKTIKGGRGLNERISNLGIDDHKNRTVEMSLKGSIESLAKASRNETNSFTQSQVNIPKFPSRPLSNSSYTDNSTVNVHQVIPVPSSSTQYGIPSTQYGPPTTPSTSNTQYGIPSKPNAQYGIPPNNQCGMPSIPQPNVQQYGIPPTTSNTQPGMPTSLRPNTQPQYGIPTTPNTQPQYGIPTTPNTQPQYGIPTTPSSTPQSLYSNQSNSSHFSTPLTSTQSLTKSTPSSPFPSQKPIPQGFKTPIQNFTPPPKSPYMGTMPPNPLKIPNPSTPQEKSTTMVNKGTPSELKVDDPQSTISHFERLVNEVRQKASQNTSIILKPRKTQFLNALNGFDSIDKKNISDSILYAMDLVIKRIEANGTNMKQDLSILVEGYSDIVWLKAFVELVKMVY